MRPSGDPHGASHNQIAEAILLQQSRGMTKLLVFSEDFYGYPSTGWLLLSGS